MGFWQSLFGGRATEGEGGDSAKRIQRQLESQAHSVSLRRLRSYGLQSVRVIDASTIQGIVNGALDEALRLRGVGVTGREREEIESLARAQLQTLMDENRRLSQAQDEVARRGEEAARQREELELSVAMMRRELEESQKQLELERDRLAAGGPSGATATLPQSRAGGAPAGAEALPEWGSVKFNPAGGAAVAEPDGAVSPTQRRALRPPSDEGAARGGPTMVPESAPVQRVVVQAEFSDAQFERLEARLRLIFERLLRDKDLFERNGEGDVVPKLAGLERELKEALHKLVDESRKSVGAEEGGGEKVEMLEKRIGKLNEALAQAESALSKLARMKNVEVGVASLWGDVGLAEDDPDYARKNELLGQVFRENLELQGKPLEDAPPELAPPPVMAGGAPAADDVPAIPSHFEAPVELPADFDFGADAF